MYGLSLCGECRGVSDFFGPWLVSFGHLNLDLMVKGSELMTINASQEWRLCAGELFHNTDALLLHPREVAVFGPTLIVSSTQPTTSTRPQTTF
jgi:hypothetical protein